MYKLLDDVLEVATFEALRAQADRAVAVRSSFFGLRQGGAVPASQLRHLAPLCLGLYNDPSFARMVTGVSGVQGLLQPLPADMPHSCSLLVYERGGDSISWHHDTNYFRGQTVTVLLTVINRGRTGLCCSANRTCAVLDGRPSCRDTPENSLLVMRGDQVLHATEPLQAGERRTVLSMVYTTDRSQTAWQLLRMKLKDLSFFVWS